MAEVNMKRQPLLKHRLWKISAMYGSLCIYIYYNILYIYDIFNI